MCVEGNNSLTYALSALNAFHECCKGGHLAAAAEHQVRVLAGFEAYMDTVSAAASFLARNGLLEK